MSPRPALAPVAPEPKHGADILAEVGAKLTRPLTAPEVELLDVLLDRCQYHFARVTEEKAP